MAPPRKQIKKERLKTNIQEIPEEEYIEELPELNLAPVDTTPNEFDNDYTLLLKIAVENEIPSNYIYISSDLSEIYSVYSILSSSSIEPSALLLETIYDEYMDQFQIETSDWVFIFIQQYKDVMSEEFLLDEMNK